MGDGCVCMSQKIASLTKAFGDDARLGWAGRAGSGRARKLVPDPT